MKVWIAEPNLLKKNKVHRYDVFFFIYLGEESVWQDKEKDKKGRIRLCGGYRFGGGEGRRGGPGEGEWLEGRSGEEEGCYGRN